MIEGQPEDKLIEEYLRLQELIAHGKAKPYEYEKNYKLEADLYKKYRSLSHVAKRIQEYRQLKEDQCKTKPD